MSFPADEILATHRWASNAELIYDCHRLGYLPDDDWIFDATYGLGTFWKLWRPTKLIGGDIDPAKSLEGRSIDFTDLPYTSDQFAAVVLDGPYKLNGQPTAAVDARYGVHERATREERMGLLRDGLTECARVLRPGGHLLFKCQDQVNGGKVRWQTIEFTNHATGLGLDLVDRFDLIGGRPQPPGRRQVHARRNTSQLLVFEKGAPRGTR